MKLLPILFSWPNFMFALLVKEMKQSSAVIGDCTSLADRAIVLEAEKSNTCFYLEVYRYQSAIYTLCECCVCDKAPMATNCEGEPLCDFTENCMRDFYANAKYLFTVEGE